MRVVERLAGRFQKKGIHALDGTVIECRKVDDALPVIPLSRPQYTEHRFRPISMMVDDHRRLHAIRIGPPGLSEARVAVGTGARDVGYGAHADAHGRKELLAQVVKWLSIAGCNRYGPLHIVYGAVHLSPVDGSPEACEGVIRDGVLRIPLIIGGHDSMASFGWNPLSQHTHIFFLRETYDSAS